MRLTPGVVSRDFWSSLNLKWIWGGFYISVGAKRTSASVSEMSYIEETMDEDEEIIFIGQYHWMYTAKAVLPLVLLWWAFGLGIYMFVSRMNKKWYNEIYVTNKRFVYRKGVTHLEIIEFSTERIFGCKVEQDTWSRFWGYGRVTISAAAVGEIRLSKFLKDPVGLRMALIAGKRPEAASVPTMAEERHELEAPGHLRLR